MNFKKSYRKSCQCRWFQGTKRLFHINFEENLRTNFQLFWFCYFNFGNLFLYNEVPLLVGVTYDKSLVVPFSFSLPRLQLLNGPKINLFILTVLKFCFGSTCDHF